MAAATTQNLPRARLLPQGTLVCPVCGDAFPLHSSTAVLACARCNAKVEICSRVSGVGAVNPIAEMVAAAKAANEQRRILAVHTGEDAAAPSTAASPSGEYHGHHHHHHGHHHHHHHHHDSAVGASAASTIAASKKHKDTRQTEDCLCEKCGVVRKCYTHALQIRGADEGQTIFYECSAPKCGHKWSLNS
jgi:DNA-directed RNA polymerase subunit M/transcription elongation factor TFIIS